MQFSAFLGNQWNTHCIFHSGPWIPSGQELHRLQHEELLHSQWMSGSRWEAQSCFPWRNSDISPVLGSWGCSQVIAYSPSTPKILSLIPSSDHFPWILPPPSYSSLVLCNFGFQIKCSLIYWKESNYGSYRFVSRIKQCCRRRTT